MLSLVDQVVDRVLFYAWAQTEIKGHMATAGKSGWAPMPAGYQMLLRSFDRDVLATDCSAFDWTFPEWLVENILDSRIARMRGVSEEVEWAMRARWREVLSTDCVVRLPDGRRLRQAVPGIMKSGWLLTISVNSEAQERLAIQAWMRTQAGAVPRVWSMGDDVLMEWPEGSDEKSFVEALAKLGVIVKQASHSLEFAGFAFGSSPAPFVDPLYVRKHRFLLRHVPSEQLEEVVSAYGCLYALARPEVGGWLAPILRQYGRWSLNTYRVWAVGLLTRNMHLLRTGDAQGWFQY